jgi:6-phosphogluconolactonase
MSQHPVPLIEVHVDADDLATAAAGELITRIEDAQARGEEPQIGLTGGGIADRVHRELARIGPDSEVDWSRVSLWWGDERFVPADSPDRNAGRAMAAFGDRLPLDPTKVHVVPSSDDVADADAAATVYADLLREHAKRSFEVLMLGMGPDGHVASLFPGSPGLDVDDRLAIAVTNSPKPPPERVSLTFAALNRSRSVWFLVSGADKATTVARALDPATGLHDVPAAGVTGELETIWFLDRDSASLL